jgi:hypothetical protein
MSALVAHGRFISAIRTLQFNAYDYAAFAEPFIRIRLDDWTLKAFYY